MLSSLKDALLFLLRLSQKRKAEKIILNAEVISHYTGVYSVEIIREIHEKEGGKNEYLKRVLDRYRQGKPKHEVYGEVFEKRFLKILQMAEKKHVPVSGVFKDYAEIMGKVEKAKKKIFSAVFRPLVIYMIAAVIVYWALGNVLSKMGGMKGVDLSGVQGFYDYYWLIMSTIPAFILTALFKFPRKVPFLKRAYRELDAFQLLSLCKMFLSMGISTVEIVKVFREVMGIKEKRRAIERSEQEEKGIKALIDVLSKYLSSEEAVVLQVAGQTYEYERVIDSMVQKRSAEFDARVEAVVGVLGEALIVVAMIPVGVLLMAIMEVLSGVASTLAF